MRSVWEPVLLVVKNDDELGKWLSGVTISMVVFFPTLTLLYCLRRPIRLLRIPNLHLKLPNLPRRLGVYFNLVLYIRF